jgi:hypothetical protein
MRIAFRSQEAKNLRAQECHDQGNAAPEGCSWLLEYPSRAFCLAKTYFQPSQTHLWFLSQCSRRAEAQPGTDMMRHFIFLPLFVLGSVIPLSLSSCASSDSSLQSRIERKIDAPVNRGVDMGPYHYNQFSQGYEPPWPFGPYSTYLIAPQGEQP